MIVLIVLVILGLVATHIVADARRDGSESPFDGLRRRRRRTRGAVEAYRRQSVIRVAMAGLLTWVAATLSIDHWMTAEAAIWTGGGIVAATAAGVIWASQRTLPSYTEDEIDAELRRLLEDSRFER